MDNKKSGLKLAKAGKITTLTGGVVLLLVLVISWIAISNIMTQSAQSESISNAAPYEFAFLMVILYALFPCILGVITLITGIILWIVGAKKSKK